MAAGIRIYLSSNELGVIVESLRYGIRHMEEYAGAGKYPKGYDYRKQSIGPLQQVIDKLGRARKKEAQHG